MAQELYANDAATTVSSGGTVAGTIGTIESWTVASSASFPAASSGASPPTQFHVADPAAPSEMVAVTNVSGTIGATWTVTRGAENTTPVVHAPGFTAIAVLTAGDLGALATYTGDLSLVSGVTEVTGAHLASALPVTQGGTGGTTATTFAVVTGGTAATTPFQQVSGVGTSGQLLTSNGAGALPSWQPTASWGARDQGFIAWNYDGPAATTGGNLALATPGTMYVMAIKLPAAANITNLVTSLVVNGGTLTSGQCFGALYQGAGGALLGTTADQSTAWGSGATKLLTMALNGGTAVSAAAGTLYAGFWFNGTTGPGFFRSDTSNSLANAGLAATASRWGTANASLTTTAPGTLGTISGAANAYWAAVS